MKALMIALIISTSAQADIFGDVGDWLNGAAASFTYGLQDGAEDFYKGSVRLILNGP